MKDSIIRKANSWKDLVTLMERWVRCVDLTCWCLKLILIADSPIRNHVLCMVHIPVACTYQTHSFHHRSQP